MFTECDDLGDDLAYCLVSVVGHTSNECTALKSCFSQLSEGFGANQYLKDFKDRETVLKVKCTGIFNAQHGFWAHKR